MPTERVQRRIDRLLDQAEEAADQQDWGTVARLATEVLGLDPDNEDAPALARAAEKVRASEAASSPAAGTPAPQQAPPTATSEERTPDSFAGGRYVVQRFLGEGGKKRVYLAHDELLDRDVAFALIKTEGLDDVGRERVVREAQAMGRMGVHPHIVSILDFGDHEGTPYVVTELMGGGDVEGLLADAEGALPLAQSLEIAKATADGLVFAHEQGVVHRDLKPGNVWLTGDGVAKIGDFGLAVAEGRSRLTQHGMMVGTFGYMPPEQALGQEVTPQADLYSLGAMLYELVTGAPPFVGDDATAVISQHLNTAPVRPSLRSEHCPPDLEALILRLLAKAPADRPASASEVLAAMDGIDPESRSASDSHLNPLDRLARGVFVGREGELERLREAADEAFAGRGSVLMLVGEPGIGKTRTAQELETYARMRGAQVLWGRAHEASGAPAYWPWVQIGRAWGRANDVRALSEVLQGAGAELVRLFPELPSILGQEPQELPPVADESAQFRLFDSYVSFLRAASDDSPLVVVLDDIHWADKPTLLLLQHMAREVSNARLLLVGTYRDTELSRTHPLSEALAELNRESGFQRVVLRGLEEPEVRAYLAATTGREPARDLVTRIFEETEGNPFFLAEVVNLMTEEGSFEAGSVSDVALPDGVREALGRRLDRLSEEANELLTTAAVVGREFDYETLKLLSEHEDDALLSLLEAALDERVIEEMDRAGRYRFTHALMQETLLDELSTTRRVRLHGAIATALERQHGARAEERAAMLAHHFLESATLTREHASQAIRYSTIAAAQAERQLAWAAAIRHLEHALGALRDLGDPPPAEEADLLAALSRCQVGLGGLVEVPFANCLRAIELYSELGEGARAGESALAALRHPAPYPTLRVELATMALAAIGDREPALEAQLLAELSAWAEPAAAAEADSRAAALAAQHRLPGVEGRLELSRGTRAMTEGRLVEAEPPLRSAHARLEGEGDFGRAGAALAILTRVELLAGDFGRASADIASALEHGMSHGINGTIQVARVRQALIAAVRCEWERFDALASEMPEHIVPYHLVVLHRGLRAAHEGRPMEGLELARQALELGAAQSREIVGVEEAGYASILHAAGEGETASAEVRALESKLAVSTDAVLTSGTCAVAGEALAAHSDATALRSYYDRICGWPSIRATIVGSGVDKVRGLFALRLDLVEEAEEHFRTGLEWAERERCPVEEGRNLQGLAEVVERRGEREQAMEYLDRAGELFSRHGAKLYLDEVLAKKEILRA
jgi:tetratricopeptide (TPR) repeat protein